MSRYQISLNLDTEKDKFIYEMIINSENKTKLIKNALFYYLHEIEKGKVIDYDYPYGRINTSGLIFKEVPETYQSSKYQPSPAIEQIIEPVIEEEYNHIQEYEEDEDDDDNMDDLEF
jgi:hypothetical protein